jgi:hypothetical protein
MNKADLIRRFTADETLQKQDQPDCRRMIEKWQNTLQQS